MSFLAPLFALLSVAAAIPVVIHLTGRSRARVRPFGAMAFLLAAHQRVAVRTRLRQLMLMLLRAAVVAVVPLILAKPFMETRSDLPAPVSGVQSAVLIIDDSLSMSYREGGRGETLLAKAKARAARLTGALPRDAGVALLLGARGAQGPIAELTSDRGRVLRAIEAVRPTLRDTDLVSAVKRAAQVLAATGRSSGRRIYLITDLTAHALEGVAAPADIELVPVDVVEGKGLHNRAVTDIKVEPTPGLGPGGVRVTAQVANFSDAPVKDLSATLWVDGKAVARGLLDVAARGEAVKRFYHVLGRGRGEEGAAKGADAEEVTGTHDISVALEADALPADDRRGLRMETLRTLRVLIVDGDPRNLRRDDEVFYLETALRPGDREDAPLELVTALPEELSRRSLSDFDAVYLCNVKAQELARGRALAVLREYVDKGGGLFITLGENTEPDSYNGTLGDLLPQPLSVVKTTGPVGQRGERDRWEQEAAVSGPGERLGRADRRHPLLRPFLGGHALEGLTEARFGRYVLLKPTPKGEQAGAVVLMSMESGAPALVERALGAGRVLLFLSTIDREWNDLPIQPAFLPLMQQAVRYLARSALPEREAGVLVGQRHDIKVSELDSRIEVTLPSGLKRIYEGERIKGRQFFGFTDTEEMGLYRVAAATEGGPLRPRPAEAFVVNSDPAESDLRRVTAERLAALSRRGGEPGGAGAQAPKRRVELWHGLGVLLLALLLGEALLLRGK